jgi:DNA-binding LacI/PurR family transcriptional regulator
MRNCELLLKTLLASLSIEFTYGRTILRGLLEAARHSGQVRIRLARSSAELRGLLASERQIYGALGMFWTAPDVRALRSSGIERVLSFAQTPEPVADLHIQLDDRAIGAMAATELAALGHERVAVFRMERHLFCELRASGFMEKCRAINLEAEVLETPEALDRWLRASGGGVFAVNDVAALRVLQSCSKYGLDVPGKVSILGADDDEVYVHLGSKLLSSLRLPFREMGADAVRRVLDPDWPRQSVFAMQPLGVIHRETTSAGKFPPQLAAFLDRLRRVRPLPSSVDAACRDWKLSRRTLELLSRRHLDRSPGELLGEERKKLASSLQAEGYSKAEVAYELGFAQARSLSRVLGTSGKAASRK